MAVFEGDDKSSSRGESPPAVSQAVMSGENMPLIGKLLRRRRHRTTAGYAHLDDGHPVEATERVWNVVAREMGNGVGTGGAARHRVLRTGPLIDGLVRHPRR